MKSNSAKDGKGKSVELTTHGTPRQRAPGAGRPIAGRSARINARVSDVCHAQLAAIRHHLGGTNSEAIEHAVEVAFKLIKD